jgi:glycosyltransferase involved in cell wall biosynthesis
MMCSAWAYRKQYDVAQVDVYSGPAFFWAEAVCGVLRRARKPYILTLHGGGLPEFAGRWPSRVRRLLQSAVIVTAPSLYLKTRLNQYCNEIRLVPNAIDCTAYRARTRRQAAPQLVWIRAFHNVYNPVLAVHVVAGLAPEFPELQLTMVGPDKDGTLAHARQLARELRVDERITFQGRVPKLEVPEWMDRGDIFLNTATVDNTPVTVLEAMASGLCIVSTDVGGLPFMLKQGENALLVRGDGPSAMMAAIRRVLQEPQLSEKLSLGAQAAAREYDWPYVLNTWENLFGQAA